LAPFKAIWFRIKTGKLFMKKGKTLRWEKFDHKDEKKFDHDDVKN
jgi:hypothetical protein